jgi:hypothetical protein
MMSGPCALLISVRITLASPTITIAPITVLGQHMPQQPHGTAAVLAMLLLLLVVVV